MEKAM